MVTDFQTGQLGDRLEWSSYLTTAIFNWDRTTNPFSTGHLRLVQSGADTVLEIDRDGNANQFVTLITFRNVEAASFTSFNLDGFAPTVTTQPRNPITGTTGNDYLNGTGSNDEIDGLAGDDTLLGQAGHDVLRGGDGNDRLEGGSGDDLLEGDDGADELRIDGGGIDTARGGGGNDLVTIFNTYDPSVTYDARVEAGDGNDRLSYRDGGSTFGAGWNSLLVADMGAGDDLVTLLSLVNGTSLTLGAGADVIELFEVADIVGVPAITDFQTGAGGDRLEWTAFLQAKLTGGDQSLNPFATGHLRLLASGADTLLQMDRDGGGNGYLALLMFRNTSPGAFTAQNFDGLPPDGSPLPPVPLTGTEDNDVLFGTSGNDEIIGAGGDDELYGEAYPTAAGGNDILRGGDGSDRLDGRGGDDVLDGGDGRDVVDYYYAPNGATVDLSRTDAQYTGWGRDTIINVEAVTGSLRNDILIGSDRDEGFNGRAGTDFIYAMGGNDEVYGYNVSGLLDGGSGVDILFYTPWDRGVSVDLTITTAQAVAFGFSQTVLGFENVWGTDYADYFSGTEEANRLLGWGGDDVLYGRGGNDHLVGGYGADTLVGGDGDDVLSGEAEGAVMPDGAAGNDHLMGGAGNDILWGGGGVDHLEGGDGDDQLHAVGAGSILDGGAGFDSTYFTGNGYQFLTPETVGFTIDVLDPSAGTSTAANTRLISIEEISGNAAADRISGGNLAETLIGSFGNDVLVGRGGDDTLSGGEDDDTLVGGTGRDILRGGLGRDTIVLEGGLSDYFVIPEGSGFAVVSAWDSDFVTDIEVVQLGSTTMSWEDFKAQAFDGLRYIAGQPDLIAAIGADAEAGRQHYLAAGRFEGRGLTGFDPLAYAASHADLLRAYGSNTAALAKHFIENGNREGRGSTGFDAISYGAANPDLVSFLGWDPLALMRHYVESGFYEGRSVTFDAMLYAASNPDLALKFGTDGKALLAHFVESGHADGRPISGFDALRYGASHADLIRAFGTDVDALTRHYVSSGVGEGRGTTFDPLRYGASHGDLAAAFGTNAEALSRHFIQSGFYEGRTSTFDALSYGASHGDLIQAFGANVDTLTRHFLQSGFGEGRAVTFDPLQYGASNPDLAIIFGTDAAGLARHFILSGYSEGRPTSGFDPILYAASNPDLARSLGSNEQALLTHYLSSGARDGRPTASFDPVAYLFSEGDLMSAGLGAEGALRHWVDSGVLEGRTGGAAFGLEQSDHRIQLGNLSDVLDGPGDRDWFDLAFPEGNSIDIALDAAFEGTLAIHDSSGRRVAFEDSRAGDDLALSLVSPDRFYIVVSGSDGSQYGTYDLIVG